MIVARLCEFESHQGIFAEPRVNLMPGDRARLRGVLEQFGHNGDCEGATAGEWNIRPRNQPAPIDVQECPNSRGKNADTPISSLPGVVC